MRFFLRSNVGVYYNIQNRNIWWQGFTLIEVLASLVILSVLLVGIVTARGKHLRQSERMVLKQQAILAVDDMLEQLWQDSEHQLEVGMRGMLEADGGHSFYWEVRPIDLVEDVPDVLEMTLVKLSVFEQSFQDHYEEEILTVEMIVSNLSAFEKTEEEDPAEGGEDET
ncbi:type IV pilus modification PilV family protein [Poriferisphaera sp. WC338]|uniref:type IV pilus modification PilV family protein n=1 Tax=Poriferisphaera sp. WC338 TaxID=3425129 RepID=UPI003D812766